MSEPAAKPDNRRQHERVPLRVRVQYLLGDKGPFEGDLRDISLGGAAISSSSRPRIGEAVTAYIDKIARLEGRVVRFFRDGFAVRFEMGARKRERLRQAIERTVHPDEHPGGADDKRQFVRAGALDARCEVAGEDGAPFTCRVKELSIVGASLETEQRPPVGALVTIGHARARVVRHTSYGFAAEFLDYWRSLSMGQDA